MPLGYIYNTHTRESVRHTKATHTPLNYISVIDL